MGYGCVSGTDQESVQQHLLSHPQAKTLIEFPSFGGAITKTVVQSANLYPYTTAWDYFILLFQIIYLGLGELCLYLFELYYLKLNVF